MASTAEKEIEIDSPLLYQKLDKLYSEWQTHPDLKDVQGLLIVLGKCPDSDHQHSLSEIFQYFGTLIGIVLILMTKSKVIFMTTHKKSKIPVRDLSLELYIEKIQEPAQYKGPKVVALERAAKGVDTAKFSELMNEVIPADGTPTQVASFVTDKLHGDFPAEFLKFVEGTGKVKLVDAASFFEKVVSIKTVGEQDIVRKGGKVLTYLFTRTIAHLEKIIDDEAAMTHKQISDQIAQFFTDAEALKHYADNSIDKDMVEIVRAPLIQSGGTYSLVPSEPDIRDISADIILISHWIKYRNYLATASRTLLIDASEQQKKTYKSLLGCFQQCISQISVGTPLKQVYAKGIEYIKTNDEGLLKYMPKSFGCGVGCKESERTLEITGENETLISPGMVLELKLGLEGMDDGKMKYAMLLSDTILLGGDGKPREILTGAVSKAFKDVSYSMSPEEETKAVEVEKKVDSRKAAVEAVSNLWSAERRLRTKDKPQNLEKESKRKQHQLELLAKKKEELQERFDSNKIQSSKKESELRSLTDLCAYESPAQLPSDAKSSGVYIDKKRESLIVPIGGRLIPFHVSTIKNVSKTEEAGTSSFLRVNFHVPGSGAAFSAPLGFPEPSGENFAFLKEITIRMSDGKELANAFRLIKELIKGVKVKDQERKDKVDLVQQKVLILNKGKRPMLNDIAIRPNVSGKKTIGVLEGHTNGLRFTSAKNEKVDIIYENIKHAFYQPCENELIVLVHFHLHNPIMVGNKKTKDVQFYSEVGLAADDLEGRRRNAQDADELEQENRERQLRAKLNAEFKRFAEQVEQVSKIEFDIPYRELGFYGVPIKSNVLLLPTLNCLVNLTEVPFCVISLNDIEVVHFERVNFSLRNFDMVLIHKDLTNFTRISCIPADSLESIKDWLNEVNILYSEGAINLNWTNLLTEIREKPESFIEQGGWEFLQEGSESEEEQEEEEKEEESDPNFDPKAEEESDSDYSGEDESDDYTEEEEEDSEENPDEELEEEGLSWDELEREAAKNDKRTEKRFGKDEKATRGKKRSKKDD